MAVPESSQKQDDHRVAGAVLGGIVGGAVGYLVATAAFDEESGAYWAGGGSSGPDDGVVLVTSLATIGGAALGAWVGHRIGAPDPNGAFPKIPDHRVTGALIGGAMGGVLGYFAGQTGGDPTAESGLGDAEMTGHAALTTLAGAALGGTIGYLMGRSTPKAGSR